jgi:oligoendopeptidase F
MYTHTLKTITALLLLVLLTGCAGLNTKKQQLLQQLAGNAQSTKSEVADKLKQTPESVLQDSLKVLDEILNYTDKVKADPDQFNAEQIQMFMHKTRIINENISRFSDLTLQTDVSFPLGTYKLENLAAAGKQKSDELIDKLLVSLIARV